MSIILFFSLSAVILLVSFIYVGLFIRHHWLKSRATDKNQIK